jgi:hypothetical protein
VPRTSAPEEEPFLSSDSFANGGVEKVQFLLRKSRLNCGFALQNGIQMHTEKALRVAVSVDEIHPKKSLFFLKNPQNFFYWPGLSRP